MLYLTDPGPRGPMGLGGKMPVNVGSDGNALAAIDYRTGKRYGVTPGRREAVAAPAC